MIWCCAPSNTSPPVQDAVDFYCLRSCKWKCVRNSSRVCILQTDMAYNVGIVFHYGSLCMTKRTSYTCDSVMIMIIIHVSACFKPTPLHKETMRKSLHFSANRSSLSFLTVKNNIKPCQRLRFNAPSYTLSSILNRNMVPRTKSAVSSLTASVYVACSMRAPHVCLICSNTEVACVL